MKSLFFIAVFATALAAAEDESGCWRTTYGRGVGEAISACPPDQEEDAALCYPPCDSGYYGVGPVCWHYCPDGYTDFGVGCTKPSYGRGVGYWSQSGCEEDHSSCEEWGFIWYPICDSGYYSWGCCVCMGSCPDGLIDTLFTCTKSTYGRGVGGPLICDSGLVEDAALCYPPCADSYNGAGPVCWHTCPEGKFECGALCFESESECIQEMLSIAEEVGLAVAEIAAAPEDAAEVLIETVAKLAPELAKPLCSA